MFRPRTVRRLGHERSDGSRGTSGGSSPNTPTLRGQHDYCVRSRVTARSFVFLPGRKRETDDGGEKTGRKVVPGGGREGS